VATPPVRRVGSAPDEVQPVPVDEVLDSEHAILDALEAAVQPTGEPKVFTLEVPGNDKVTMDFNYAIEFDIFQAWQKRATNRKTQEVDYMKLSLPVISTCNVGVRVNGKLATKDGDPLTVAHPRIHEMLKVPIGSTAAAIRKLYVLDGLVIQTMRQIIEKAGYSIDGEVNEVDAGDTPLGS
jgi:hypothetical protein